MPKEDVDALKYLDDLWINDCVTQLPGEKIFEIANKAEARLLFWRVRLFGENFYVLWT